MTKEEKNEMRRKRKEKFINKRKSRIVFLAVVPVVGVALTLVLGFVGDSRQNELKSATVLDKKTVGEFLDEEQNGKAIYTGTIKAVDPVSIREENGEYIELRRTVERVEKTYDEEEDKYDTKTETISNDMDHCDEIEMDDVVVKYTAFHGLPTYGDTKTEGADSNQLKTKFSYVPSKVEGTFFLKCKNGEVSSAQYFESTDIAGESKKGFNLARIIIWVLLIAIEVFLVYDIIKTSKTIKIIEEK